MKKKVREMALNLDANEYKYQFFAENVNTSYVTFLIDHCSRFIFFFWLNLEQSAMDTKSQLIPK